MSGRITVVVTRRTTADRVDVGLDALRRAARGVPCSEILLVGGEDEAQADDAGPVVRRLETADVGSDAWNAGAEAATGDLLLFIPAETVADAELLLRHAAEHRQGDASLVVGSVVPAPGAHPLAWVSHTLPPDGPPLLAAAAGQTVSLPRAVFQRAGGVSGGLAWGAEVELADRVTRLGLGLRWLSGPVGRQAKPATASRAMRDRAEAGQGSVALYRRDPQLLPHLELGGFHAGGPPAPELRRLLLALGGPPVPPAAGVLLPRRRWRERWLRFQHEYHFWRGVRRAAGGDPLWRSLARPPVILMYHAVGGPGEPAGCYVVPLPRFRRQMRWLARRGYRVIGLEELLEHRRTHRPAPPRAVVITFDDGYADNHDLALPVLRERGFRATFFLVSGCLEATNRWDTAGELAGRRMLSWEQARALQGAGMEIGAHTRSHPVLPELAPEEAAREIAGGKADLETALERPVRTFAYPFGRLDAGITAKVGEAGFEAACCSRSSPNDPAVPALLLRRVEVRGTDSFARFALAVHRGWTARRRRP